MAAPRLTSFEVGQIVALRCEGYAYSDIVDTVVRSHLKNHLFPHLEPSAKPSVAAKGVLEERFLQNTLGNWPPHLPAGSRGSDR